MRGGLVQGVRWLGRILDEKPTSNANMVVRTATSMPSHSGGWLGMEAMAANAKMWKREPAGRSRSQEIATEQAPATTVVAKTSSHVCAAVSRPRAGPIRAA